MFACSSNSHIYTASNFRSSFKFTCAWIKFLKDCFILSPTLIQNSLSLFLWAEWICSVYKSGEDKQGCPQGHFLVDHWFNDGTVAPQIKVTTRIQFYACHEHEGHPDRNIEEKLCTCKEKDKIFSFFWNIWASHLTDKTFLCTIVLV